MKRQPTEWKNIFTSDTSVKGHISQTHSQHHAQQAKTESVSLKIRNKTGMSVFTTLIQRSTGSPSHCNQTRTRNKGHANWKE